MTDKVDYTRVRDVIKSCQTDEQLDAAMRYAALAGMKCDDRIQFIRCWTKLRIDLKWSVHRADGYVRKYFGKEINKIVLEG